MHYNLPPSEATGTKYAKECTGLLKVRITEREMAHFCRIGIRGWIHEGHLQEGLIKSTKLLAERLADFLRVVEVDIPTF